MAALKGDYLRSILLRASIWKPLGSRAPLASLAALARSLRSPHTGAASILEDLGSLFGVSWKRLGFFLGLLGPPLGRGGPPSGPPEPPGHPQKVAKKAQEAF